MEELLKGHDDNANITFVELKLRCDEMMPRLIELKNDAIRAELNYVDLSRSAEQLSAANDLVYQTKRWALHMSDAAARLEKEIEAIEAVNRKMTTYVHERNTMVAFLKEAIKDVRDLNERTQVRPSQESVGVQTDDLDISIDVSRIYVNYSISFIIVLITNKFLFGPPHSMRCLSRHHTRWEIAHVA